VVGDDGGQRRARVGLAGAQPGQVQFDQVLDVTLRQLQPSLFVEGLPDLGPRAVLVEAQPADAGDDVEPVAAAAHLARLGLGRAVDGARERAGRVRAAVAKVGEMLRAGQELDRLGPDGVAEDEPGAAVGAGGQFGTVADMG
jgi:hypothetical protein